jgi:nucleotide-binding universal stress UspA family protein
MLPLRTILVPTDFSEPSWYALQLACALARDHGAHLLLMHVGAAPVIAYAEGILPVDADAYALELRENLGAISVPDANIAVERRLVMGTDPVSDILHVAEDEPCDLIVMGTHGRTGLRRVLLGSVAEQVVRRATCPVLTVKMPFPMPATVEETPALAGAVASAP